jgi:hypothetical protein
VKQPTVPAGPDIRATMWDMITAYRTSQIVRSAAVFSLAEHCTAEGSITAASIARAEGTHPETTARLLRACAAINLLTCDDDEKFTATPLLDILRRDAEGSQWGFAVSLPGPGHWRPWGELAEAIRTGSSQASSILGGDLFEYYGTHPQEGASFFEGLTGMTAVAGAEAARVIDLTGVEQAVDVGGATGTLLHDLMAINQEFRGVVLDVPPVAAQAAQAAKALGLEDRLTTVGGDFFVSVPEGADMYLLRYVLHDWDDDSCLRVLRNCCAAMKPGARLCVMEMVLGKVGAEDAVVPMQDLNMLAVLHGKERSLAQFDKLFEEAGLRRTSAIQTNSPMWVIEATAA